MTRRKGPNLQNIPIGTEEGRRIRSLFRSPVTEASFAHDVMDGEQPLDIHAETAKAIFGDEPPATPEEAKARRDAARTIAFDALYGGGQAHERLRKLMGKSR